MTSSLVLPAAFSTSATTLATCDRYVIHTSLVVQDALHLFGDNRGASFHGEQTLRVPPYKPTAFPHRTKPGRPNA